jgi:hypothetical protein
MTDISIANVRQLSTEFYNRGDFTGWFESLYAQADSNLSTIPWADCAVNPWLVEWLQQWQVRGDNKSCLAIGCGLGDDDESTIRTICGHNNQQYSI